VPVAKSQNCGSDRRANGMVPDSRAERRRTDADRIPLPLAQQGRRGMQSSFMIDRASSRLRPLPAIL